jgi:hypothetical protein
MISSSAVLIALKARVFFFPYKLIISAPLSHPNVLDAQKNGTACRRFLPGTGRPGEEDKNQIEIYKKAL